MCTSGPKIPQIPEIPQRQAVKQPDQGADVTARGDMKRKRAMFAGLFTSPGGAVGAPNIGKATLG